METKTLKLPAKISDVIDQGSSTYTDQGLFDRNAAAMMAIAKTAYEKGENLQVHYLSLVGIMAFCGKYGVELAPNMKEANLTFYYGKSPSVQMTLMWRFYANILEKHGYSYNVGSRYESDIFRYNNQTREIYHEFDPFATDRGAWMGAYAQIVRPDGRVTQPYFIDVANAQRRANSRKGESKDYGQDLAAVMEGKAMRGAAERAGILAALLTSKDLELLQATDDRYEATDDDYISAIEQITTAPTEQEKPAKKDKVGKATKQPAQPQDQTPPVVDQGAQDQVPQDQGHVDQPDDDLPFSPDDQPQDQGQQEQVPQDQVPQDQGHVDQPDDDLPW